MSIVHFSGGALLLSQLQSTSRLVTSCNPLPHICWHSAQLRVRFAPFPPLTTVYTHVVALADALQEVPDSPHLHVTHIVDERPAVDGLLIGLLVG